jgi:hypothetical protein
MGAWSVIDRVAPSAGARSTLEHAQLREQQRDIQKLDALFRKEVRDLAIDRTLVELARFKSDAVMLERILDKPRPVPIARESPYPESLQDGGKPSTDFVRLMRSRLDDELIEYDVLGASSGLLVRNPQDRGIFDAT